MIQVFLHPFISNITFFLLLFFSVCYISLCKPYHHCRFSSILPLVSFSLPHVRQLLLPLPWMLKLYDTLFGWQPVLKNLCLWNPTLTYVFLLWVGKCLCFPHTCKANSLSTYIAFKSTEVCKCHQMEFICFGKHCSFLRMIDLSVKKLMCSALLNINPSFSCMYNVLYDDISRC